MNERILRDGCEAVAHSGGLAGATSSPTVDHWLVFVGSPNARTWYRAHNGSVVAAYLEHREQAEAENAAERFFMNVVLCRVLFARIRDHRAPAAAALRMVRAGARRARPGRCVHAGALTYAWPLADRDAWASPDTWPVRVANAPSTPHLSPETRPSSSTTT